jgi:hypothetical protein
MKKLASLILLLLMMSFAAVAQADYTLTLVTAYSPDTDPHAFTYYCPTPVEENFEDTTLIPGLSITEVGGVGIIPPAIFGNFYENIVDASVPRYQTFNYSSGMRGWGAWFDLAGPGGPGSGIDVYLADNDQFIMTIPGAAAGEFYGFITAGTFTGVKFMNHPGTDGVQETYDLDGLAVCPAPIPPSAILLGTALLGLVGLRFRKKLT